MSCRLPGRSRHHSTCRSSACVWMCTIRGRTTLRPCGCAALGSATADRVNMFGEEKYVDITHSYLAKQMEGTYTFVDTSTDHCDEFDAEKDGRGPGGRRGAPRRGRLVHPSDLSRVHAANGRTRQSCAIMAFLSSHEPIPPRPASLRFPVARAPSGLAYDLRSRSVSAAASRDRIARARSCGPRTHAAPQSRPKSGP